MLPRRAFLKLGLWLSGLLASWGTLRFLSYTPPPENPTRVTLGEPLSYPAGSLMPVPQATAWLGRDEGGLYAISAVCTHLGCTVEQKEGGFECPCHGSRFDPQGGVLQGPAREPLNYLEISLNSENLVVIDRSVIVPPTQRLEPTSF